MRSSSTIGFMKLLIPALGMSFLWPYFRASFLSFFRTFCNSPYPLVNATYTAYALTFVLVAAIAVFFAPQLARLIATRRISVALAVLGALGNALLWIGGTRPAIEGCCVVGTVTATVFFTGAVLRYGMGFSTQTSRATALIAFASFGLGFLDNVALASPAPIACAFCITGPVICMLCAPAVHAGTEEPVPAASIPATASSATPARFAGIGRAGSNRPAVERTPSLTALLALIVLLALFCLTGNVVRGLTNPWFSSSVITMRSVYMSIANLVFVAVSLALLIRGVNTRKVLFWSWATYMVVFFMGLLTLVFAPESVAGVGSDVATVSRVCFTLLMFLFALEACQWTDLGPTRLLALVLLMPESLAAFVRHIVVSPLLAATGMEPIIAASYAGVAIILVLSMTIIIVLSGLLLKQVERDPEPPLPTEQAPEPVRSSRAAQALDQLAATYGLTTREAQTASYVSKGYSLEKTAELLGISINTVRTHMRSTYGKLSIHSRQELIDLLDEQGAPADFPIDVTHAQQTR